MSVPQAASAFPRPLAPVKPTRIRRLELYRVALPLATPLAHSQVSTDVLDEVFLALTLDDGTRGVGEVRGNGAYATGHDTEAVVSAVAGSAQTLLGSEAKEAATAVLATTETRLATALVEAATFDALARQAGVPLWRYLGATRAPSLETHASVAFLSPDEAASRARSALAAGFRRFKIRVGGPDVEADVARVAAVRAVAPRAELVLDANGAWTADEAISAARRLEPHGIRWLEQPTPPGDHAALREVRASTPIPVVADESVRAPDDVVRLVAAQAVDGVHLKLEKCGTVTELRRAVAIARNAGLLVEIGMMDQGRVGSATIACIASTIPADAYELWGFERVRRDVGSGLDVASGAMRLSDRAGNGVDVELPVAGLVGSWV